MFGVNILTEPAHNRPEQWAAWPDQWTTGLAGTIVPPAEGAWTAPKQLGHVNANLQTMWKRLENLQRADILARPEVRALLGGA